MRSVAVINQKGGVGKTTTAVNLAAALSRMHGQRVLLVDLDPQSHASLHLGVEAADGELSIYDVLVRGAALAEAARYTDHKVTIVPAHIDLVASDVELSSRDGREFVLRNALAPHAPHFDTLVIDCPPSLGLLTVNALSAVDEVLIPLQAHFLGLQGLSKLLETVAAVRAGFNPRLRVSGILLCMFEASTKLAQEVASDISGFLSSAAPVEPWFGARLFEARIRRNIKLAECPSFGKSIFEYDGASNGAADYAGLAREWLAAHQPVVRSVAASDVVPAAAATDSAASSSAV
jgi:chromosome partitioning protein